MDVRIIRPKKNLRLPRVRPSVLSQQSSGEAWLCCCTHPELLVVYLNNHPITLLPGTALELSSLNQILFSLRHRAPRQIDG